jgi:predicted RND superfamily exporter protein
MSLNNYHIRWSIVFVVAVIVALLFIWETNHLKIETDIMESMPQNDPVLSDARQIIRHLPIQDKLFIDLEQQSSDKDKLVNTASLVTQRLSKSGFFTKVGISDDANNFPELMTYVTDNWPLLFSAADLEQKVKPLLAPDKIGESFYFNKQSLQQLEGIGRS